MTHRFRTAPVPAGIGSLLEARAEEAGDRVAFIEGASGMALTWGNLAVEAERWRRRATALAGQRVGLLIGDPLAMIAAYLGALAAGVTVAPFNPEITPHELVEQDRLLGLAALVTDGDAHQTRAILPSTELWTTSRAGLAVEGGPSPTGRRRRRRGPRAATASLVLASSGTTGVPKIIVLPESNLLHTAGALVASHGLGAEDRGYCPLPLFHINALVVGVLSTVVCGSSLIQDRRFSASHFWPQVEAFGATWLNLVPAIITVLSERPGPPADVARRVAFARSASAPLPLAIRERFERHCGVSVLETYGMTEAASQIAANPRDPAERRVGSVGRPIGLDLRIVDRHRRVVDAGTVGQVEIRGANVVRSYGEPAGSEPGFRCATDAQGWLSTGDMGHLDDGFVYLVGRCDDVINRGGEKLYPREIEEVLLSDPAVSAAAVVGRAHPTMGEEPVAFVIATSGVDIDDAALAARLSERCQRDLSRFKRPASITVAQHLPSGPTGKIRHAELRRAVAAVADTP